jgi:hypothetical protein
VRLFVERAQAVKPGFELDAANAAAVAQVCRRLDGVPLAILLAAARVPALNPAELARRLDRRFEVLAGGRRRAIERHQTLRSAIDWSYELLTEPERRLLARLAVFAGGCTLEAIEAVCAAPPVQGRAVLELVAGLVAKSLVVAEDHGAVTRYRLLETIRQYSEERLDQHGETSSLRAAYAEYYYRLALELEEDMDGPQQGEASRRLQAEQENLLAAANHAVDTDDADLALRLVRAATHPVRRFGYEVHLPLDAMLGLTGATDHPLYPYALLMFASRAASRGELVNIEANCQEALAAARHLDADSKQMVGAMVANARSTAAASVRRWGEAAAQAEIALEIWRSTNRLALCSLELWSMATLYMMAEQPDVAIPFASEGLEIARRIGTPVQIGINLAALADALADRDPGQARVLLEESLKMRSAAGIDQAPPHATYAVLVAARTRDWTLTLRVAEPAIRYLQWGGERPWLSGVFNVVARAIAPTDAAAAAMLQGAARQLMATATPPPRAVARAATVEAATPAAGSFAAKVWRETSGLVGDSLGEVHLAELRAQGEAMDQDHAVAYALEVITRVLRDSTPT